MSRNLKIKSTRVAFLCPITTLSRNTRNILQNYKIQMFLCSMHSIITRGVTIYGMLTQYCI